MQTIMNCHQFIELPAPCRERGNMDTQTIIWTTETIVRLGGDIHSTISTNTNNLAFD
jgi:hypothetical protein